MIEPALATFVSARMAAAAGHFGLFCIAAAFPGAWGKLSYQEGFIPTPSPGALEDKLPYRAHPYRGARRALPPYRAGFFGDERIPT